MNKLQFKEIYEKFTKALKYIVDNTEELKKDPHKWDVVKNNFYTKFEKPLDDAWDLLPEEDKKYLAELYIQRKTSMDETVQKVIKTFNGKIAGI